MTGDEIAEITVRSFKGALDRAGIVHDYGARAKSNRATRHAAFAFTEY